MSVSYETAAIGSPEANSVQYTHLTFGEADAPHLAEAAWRLHATGYRDMGFVDNSAIVPDGPLKGTLYPDIDKSRGPNTRYYLSVDENGTYAATMRKVDTPEGGSYRDLPAYQLCGDSLSPIGRHLLNTAAERSAHIVEISGLARPKEIDKGAIDDIVREALHDAIGNDELWVFSIVSTTYGALARHSFGDHNLTTIGEDTSLHDPRVNERIKLRPALLYPDQFLDNLLTSYEEATTPQMQARMLDRFLFYSDGLADEKMTGRVAVARAAFLASAQPIQERNTPMPVPAPTLNEVEALIAPYRHDPEAWQDPSRFNLVEEAGRVALKTAVEAGQITGVVDPIDPIANELFEVTHPSQMRDTAARADFVSELKARGTQYGEWFLFPWSGQLVHYSPQEEHRALRTDRNKDMVTAEEQARLYRASVLVGGLSVGSNVVREMLSAGIGGELILADMDRLGVTNLNRINGGQADVGRLKVDHAAMQISEADPYVRQVHLREGVTAESLARLESNPPDIIFDEVDSLQAKAQLRDFARRHRIPLVMVTDAGETSVVDVERYDQDTAEPFAGRLSPELYEKILNGTAGPYEQLKAMVQIVGIRNASARVINTLMERGKTRAGIAQLGSTASKGGALAAVTAREILLGRKMDTGRYIDSSRKTLGAQKLDSLVDTAKSVLKFRRFLNGVRKLTASKQPAIPRQNTPSRA